MYDFLQFKRGCYSSICDRITLWNGINTTGNYSKQHFQSHLTCINGYQGFLQLFLHLFISQNQNGVCE